MTEPQTKSKDLIAFMHQFITEVQVDGNLDAIAKYIHPDYIEHTFPVNVGKGLAGAQAILKSFHDCFSEVQINVIHCIADEHVIAVNKKITARQVGDFFGTPPSGKMCEFHIMDFFTLQDAKLNQHWGIVGPLTPLES